MTAEATELHRLADDGGPHACGDPCCGAAAELAAIRARAADILARPWDGPYTTWAKDGVCEALGLPKGGRA